MKAPVSPRLPRRLKVHIILRILRREERGAVARQPRAIVDRLQLKVPRCRLIGWSPRETCPCCFRAGDNGRESCRVEWVLVIVVVLVAAMAVIPDRLVALSA